MLCRCVLRDSVTQSDPDLVMFRAVTRPSSPRGGVAQDSDPSVYYDEVSDLSKESRLPLIAVTISDSHL